MSVDLEQVWENHASSIYEAQDIDGIMGSFGDKPYVNYVPVNNGGMLLCSSNSFSFFILLLLLDMNLR